MCVPVCMRVCACVHACVCLCACVCVPVRMRVCVLDREGSRMVASRALVQVAVE